MKKYIVPAKDRIAKWRSHFDEVFRSEEHQIALMQILVTMAFWLAYGNNKKENEFIDLFESSLCMAVELANTGLISEDSTDDIGQLAYEFCVSLSSYLKEVGILSKIPTVMKFEGFVGFDIVIKVLEAGEPYVDEMEERAWQAG